MGNQFCCVQEDQSTVAIEETYGKFEEFEPGCCFLPWSFVSQPANYLTLRNQQLDVRCETKTKDDVFVNVVASIQYGAIAYMSNDAFYKLINNTRGQIQAYVFDVIRASVSKLLLDDVFEQTNEIAKAVQEELDKAMSPYGLDIVQTLIVDIELNEHVMKEINAAAAARMRLAANEKAEAKKIAGESELSLFSLLLVAGGVALGCPALPFQGGPYQPSTLALLFLL